MAALLEFSLRGILTGAVYGLLAVPMSLAFATLRTIDFAIGGYALLAAAVASNVPGPLGIAAGLAAAVAASGVMAGLYLALVRRSDDHIVPSLASFGLTVVIASLVLTIWGTQPFLRPTFDEFWSLAGIRLNPQGIINIAIAIVTVGVLYAVLYRTDLGRMMRATAVNPGGAELAGIPTDLIRVGTYLAGGLIGGLAGTLILFNSGLDFTAPLGLTLSGFGAAIVFGIASPVRGLLGGLAMGAAEALASGYATGMVATMVPFAFVLIVLAATRGGALAADRP